MQAGQAAVSLEKTQATLRAVAGSQATYNEALRIAQANQALFGGSLERNLAPMQQFLFIANRSGASLDELNRVAQLLATVNPAEGIEGAGFALSEAFSGDLTSIVERFNLPRAALRDLLNEAENADQVLAGVTDLLAQQGVNADTLSASLTENARVYNEFSAAASQAFTDIGAAASTAAAPVASFLTDVLKATSAQIQNTTEAGGVNAAALDPLIQASYESLTGAVRAYADAQIAAGQSTGAAVAAAMQYGATLDTINVAMRGSVDAQDASAASATALGERMAALASSSEGQAATISALATAYSDGKLSLDELVGSITAMETAQTSAAIATANSADAQAALSGYTDDATAAIAEQAGILDLTAQAAAAEEAALRAATEAAFDQANAGADLEAQARAAAQALADAGAAGAGAAAQLAGSSSRVDVLTAAYYRLIAAQQAAGAQTAGTGGLGKLRDTVKGAGEATAAIRTLARVYNTGPLATKPSAGGRSGGRSGGGGAGAAGREAEAQQREQAALYDKLRDLQERYQDQAVQAERTYQERVLSITQEFAKRRADAERSFADAQVSSRADFYTSLASVDKSQRTAMIQEFEQAQVKAAEIAATQGADAGEKYLSQITEVIRARAQRQADIAKALEAGDKDEAEFLRGVDAIARAAEQRKLDAAASGGEGLAGQERAALDEAATTRDESLAKAQLQAQQGLIDAEQARADKAKVTNEQLQTQLDLVRQIAQAGGVPGAIAAPATTPAPATATPAEAAAATGAGTQPAGAGLVLSAAPSVEGLLSQAISELRRLRSSPNYAPGA